MRHIWGGRLARNSGWLVAFFALAGLGIAAVVMFSGPFQLPTDLKDRASVSGAIGGLLGLLAAIVAITTAIWINTSDFKAEQAVSTDTAILRAALRSILIKGVNLKLKEGLVRGGASGSASKQRGSKKTFDGEREAINKFMTSTTAFGYWSWVDYRSIQAGYTQTGWRTFFKDLAEVVEACEAPSERDTMLAGAFRLEDLLSKMTRGDIGRISSYVADLTGGLGGATGDVTLSSLRPMYAEKVDVEWKFQHLELKGISSPNVELFLGVFRGDLDRVKRALDAGADPGLTDGQVLDAYASQLMDFDPAEWS